jgi:hypothetical protein
MGAAGQFHVKSFADGAVAIAGSLIVASLWIVVVVGGWLARVPIVLAVFVCSNLQLRFNV